MKSVYDNQAKFDLNKDRRNYWKKHTKGLYVAVPIWMLTSRLNFAN